MLRKAFGDRGLIQTVPRRGYRLAAEISFAAPGRALGLCRCAQAPTLEPSGESADVPVLVVDDDPSVRTALGRLLRSQGIPHHLFASAEALFEARLETPYACLLLDMHLPDITGLCRKRCASWRCPGRSCS